MKTKIKVILPITIAFFSLVGILFVFATRDSLQPGSKGTRNNAPQSPATADIPAVTGNVEDAADALVGDLEAELELMADEDSDLDLIEEENEEVEQFDQLYNENEF